MQIHRFTEASRITRDIVLTIGNFDGVHLGHQALLRRVVRSAGGRADDGPELPQETRPGADPVPCAAAASVSARTRRSHSA